MAALMEMEELVEAFLLRLPPDDPASLVRAALVCKLWRRILADPGFRRRYCELHRRPPVLGFLAFKRNDSVSYFTPTSSFRPRNAVADLGRLYAIHSHHGRVLLFRRSLLVSHSLQSNPSLAVWNPISGDLLELPKLPAPQNLGSIGFGISWNAAVLCASNPSSACDSIDCYLGYFLVVFMGTSQRRAYVYVYSSQAATWSEPTSAALDPLGPIKSLYPIGHRALAGNALYFTVYPDVSVEILKYDLGTQEISSVNLPSDFDAMCHTLLTTTEYGVLGIARVESPRLHLSSEVAGPGGRHLGWTPSRVIELNTVLPANTHSFCVVAFLHGLGAFLISTNDGVFSVDIESNRARKVCEGSCDVNVVPYISFCTPAPDVALTNTGNGPGASIPR